jgi:hypothetical protein
MATPDSSGVERRRVCLDSNRPRTHPSPSPRRKPIRKLSASKAGASIRVNVTKRTHRPTRSQAPASSLAERIDEERNRLFKAMSIIACCRLACASLLDQGGNQEVMTDALQAAYDLIDATAGELEIICACVQHEPATAEAGH